MRIRLVTKDYVTFLFSDKIPQVWALAVSSDERTIASGAADSVVTFWEDCTEEQEQEKESKRAEMVLKYVY